MRFRAHLRALTAGGCIFLGRFFKWVGRGIKKLGRAIKRNWKKIAIVAGIAVAAIFTAGVAFGATGFMSGTGSGFAGAMKSGAAWLGKTGAHIKSAANFAYTKSGTKAVVKPVAKKLGIKAGKSKTAAQLATEQGKEFAHLASKLDPIMPGGPPPFSASASAAAKAAASTPLHLDPVSALQSTVDATGAAQISPTGILGKSSTLVAQTNPQNAIPAAAAKTGFWKAAQPYIAPVLMGTGLGITQHLGAQAQQDAALDNWRRQLEITTPPAPDWGALAKPDLGIGSLARNIDNIQANKQRLMSPLLASPV